MKMAVTKEMSRFKDYREGSLGRVDHQLVMAGHHLARVDHHLIMAHHLVRVDHHLIM